MINQLLNDQKTQHWRDGTHAPELNLNDTELIALKDFSSLEKIDLSTLFIPFEQELLPMSDEVSPIEKLMQMQEELKRYYTLLEPAWEYVLNNEVSKYPIAIFSTLPIEAGVLLINRDEAPGPWSVRMSTLEEFSIKGLVSSERIDDFRKTYKDPELHFCTFVISDLGAQYLFLPR